jgi:hypothetical protein
MEIANFYRPTILQQAQRILSLVNRNPFSSTFGCFDRNYWHYKTISDYPCATYQQAVLMLALLYKNNFDGNIYYNNPKIFKLAIAGIEYWAKIQNKDGSFNEWYHNEHSFCATAFTTYAITEACLILEDKIKSIDKNISDSWRKAGKWLMRHSNAVVSNQMMAALNALYNVYLLTNDSFYLKASSEKRKTILQQQNPEGWFPEYGGADIGYSFLSLDLLAHHWQKTKDDDIFKSIEKLLIFLSFFIHPDGSVGGDYGSRNTVHCLPFGLELLAANDNIIARKILTKLYNSMIFSNVLTPQVLDDKYLSYFYLNSYIQAALVHIDFDFESSGQEEKVQLFKQAGIFVKQNDLYYAVLGISKSGVIKIFSQDKLVYSDSGYVGQTERGSRICSQFFNANGKYAVEKQSGSVFSFTLLTDFRKLDDSLPLEKYSIPFKICTSTLFKSDLIARLFKEKLKQRKITSMKKVPVKLERKVMLHETFIEISDKISLLNKQKIKSLNLIDTVTTTYSPSADFFLSNEIEPVNPNLQEEQLVDILNKKGHIKVIQKFQFSKTGYNIDLSITE